MKTNGAGIYGSRAWIKYGEGTNKQPSGALWGAQANAVFTTDDWRFTVGEDGYLYAYCMKIPQAGAQLSITSLGTSQNSQAKPIGSVTLLGGGDVVFSQTANALQITYTDSFVDPNAGRDLARREIQRLCAGGAKGGPKPGFPWGCVKRRRSGSAPAAVGALA